ncbi:protein TAPETUM DETERMINANT 1 [Cinnamomum micranthum f. kanehirae]|uniref:Protein TAPETUM DETERMINANT 1 n=1 Tax=Cinnamomum micranthum f. kanehirae TaxID=337451 RepID=A0A443PQS3_9MAGN|nr:protein TAPETUM DETERMINANT 1 [Cinnamomum micranthum f. kanehirae]
MATKHQLDKGIAAFAEERRLKENIILGSAHYKRKVPVLSTGICTKRDISISQSKSSSSGIPQYIVQIASTCMSGYAPSNIHVRCGWFASARIVNPNTFKRLSYDDCLVNTHDKDPLNSAEEGIQTQVQKETETRSHEAQSHFEFVATAQNHINWTAEPVTKASVKTNSDYRNQL